MAVRNLLSIDKTDEFKEWLVYDGWTLQDPIGIYEVFRARKGKRTFIAYKKLYAKKHLSVSDFDAGVVQAYLKDKRNGWKPIAKKPYTVEPVVCDYGVYEKGELIPGMILNSRANAQLIADILNADTEHEVHHSTVLWRRYTGEME